MSIICWIYRWRFCSNNFLKGRSENSIKNRFHALTVKKGLNVRLALKKSKERLSVGQKIDSCRKGPIGIVKHYTQLQTISTAHIGVHNVAPCSPFGENNSFKLSTGCPRQVEADCCEEGIKKVHLDNQTTSAKEQEKICTKPNAVTPMTNDVPELLYCYNTPDVRCPLIAQNDSPSKFGKRSNKSNRLNDVYRNSPTDFNDTLVQSPPRLKRLIQSLATPDSKVHGRESFLSPLSPEPFYQVPVIASPNGSISLKSCFQNAEQGYTLGVCNDDE